MHLVSFSGPRGDEWGVLLPEAGVIAMVRAAAPELPPTLLGLIRAGGQALERVRAVLGQAPCIDAAAVRLRAPIPEPPRDLICVGKNYREHAREFDASGYDASAREEIPEAPVVFTKATTTVIGPGDPIPASQDPTGTVDYEGELAVVIGRGGRGIRREDAYAHVFGYTIVNDVTSRALQRRHRQWFIGKSLDGFGPMGPALVTADAVGDPARLRLITEVDGEVRQDASVGDLIFDIPTLIETISRHVSLVPGDIIATGTPAGVGIGFDPPRFLRPGSRVRITVEPIGTLDNPVT